MNTSKILLTIVGIQRYKGRFPFSAGRELIGAKEPENAFDKNAIKILDVGNTLVGYIANNPNTALEDTLTAAEVYEKLGDYCVIKVVRSTNYNVTCKVIEPDFKTEKLIKAFTTDRFDPSYPFSKECPPTLPYPFDYCEFPFEYDLVNIDLMDDTIPYEWRIYLIGCDLGIEAAKIAEIEEIANDASDQDLFYLDALDILYELKWKENRDTETIENIIREYLEDNEELFDKDKDEIAKIAAKISDVING